MAAFNELDWRRLDVGAIVEQSGLAVIDVERRTSCREWLERNGYKVETLDCRGGLDIAIPALGRMLDWEGQFGYVLGPDSRNLDALNDGFEFDASGGGCVLEILGADVAWQEDPRWLLGLLSIAQAHSRRHLALGQRFFTLLVLPKGSPLIGVVIEEVKVPGCLGI